MIFRCIKADENGQQISPELAARFPKDVAQGYWDYDNTSVEYHLDKLERHRQTGCETVYFGGIWGWMGYGLNYPNTLGSAHAALAACKQAGIKEVYATIWGDASTECNIYAHLLGMQVYAEHAFAETVSEEKLRERVKFCTGVPFDAYMDLRYLDELPGFPEGNPAEMNPSKYLFYQDVMYGLVDVDIAKYDTEGHYSALAAKMAAHAKDAGEYAFVFEYEKLVCEALAVKAKTGLRLYTYYQNGDRAALTDMRDNVLPDVGRKVAAVRAFARDLFMEINHPYGWELMDIKYGGVLMRVDTAIRRLDDYLTGKIPSLPELEGERLSCDSIDILPSSHCYTRYPSMGRLALSAGYMFDY